MPPLRHLPAGGVQKDGAALDARAVSSCIGPAVVRVVQTAIPAARTVLQTARSIVPVARTMLRAVRKALRPTRSVFPEIRATVPMAWTAIQAARMAPPRRDAGAGRVPWGGAFLLVRRGGHSAPSSMASGT